VGEESFFQEIFDKFILEQKERAKEREHKRREDKVLEFVLLMFCAQYFG
jgi:hypothetical protein